MVTCACPPGARTCLPAIQSASSPLVLARDTNCSEREMCDHLRPDRRALLLPTLHQHVGGRYVRCEDMPATHPATSPTVPTKNFHQLSQARTDPSEKRVLSSLGRKDVPDTQPATSPIFFFFFFLQPATSPRLTRNPKPLPPRCEDVSATQPATSPLVHVSRSVGCPACPRTWRSERELPRARNVR